MLVVPVIYRVDHHTRTGSFYGHGVDRTLALCYFALKNRNFPLEYADFGVLNTFLHFQLLLPQSQCKFRLFQQELVFLVVTTGEQLNRNIGFELCFIQAGNRLL